MTKRNKNPDCFLSFAEVAKLTSLDETTIHNGQCGTDELLRIRLGRRTVLSFNDVKQWMESRMMKWSPENDAMNKAIGKIRLLYHLALEKADMLEALTSRSIAPPGDATRLDPTSSDPAMLETDR